MPLCRTCEKLDLRDLTDSDNDLEDVRHHNSLADLKLSALSCALCELFFKQLSLEAEIDKLDLKSSPIILRGRQHVDNEGNQGGIWQLKVRCDSARIRALFGLCPDDEDNNAIIPRDIIIGGAIKPPEERFELLRLWIHNCTVNHKHCSSPIPKLPSRVIDVGVAGRQEPFIKETYGELNQYITLSHCWGAKPLIKTTKATFPQHKVQMPMNTLPKTFQDAITITRMLSIRYLWIDSLCIIQDDAQDWERESALMGQIYSQAFLTIAAAASKDSSGGCFLPRRTDTHVRVKCSIDDSRVGHVYIKENPKGFSDLDHGILNTRAWVAQERLLSPRTIHFDVDQLLWECREDRLAEDTIPANVFSTQHLVWDGRLHLEYPYPVERAGARKFIWDWYQFIDNYTTRGLTKSEDKLPALSGLATVMEQRTGDKYVAGLWESHLSLGMTWRRRDKRSWLVGAGSYRAPSWSWAAWDGPVWMPEEADIEASANPFILVAEVLDVKVEPKGLDPNGELAFGAVVITSRLKLADPRVDPQSSIYERYPEEGAGQDHIWDNGESVGWADYDEAFKPGGPAKLYCLQMSLKRLFKRDLCHALLLEPTGKENEFRRIGLGCTGGGSLRTGWFEDVPKTTITIV